MFSPVIEIPAEVPRSIVLNPPLSDEEFERLSERTRCAIVERAKDGKIQVGSLAGAMTSSANSEITCQLRNWWIQHRRGRAFGSKSGFFLPDGSSLNPHAAYVTAEQLTDLSRDDLAHFLRLSPAFIIELRSPSDRLASVEEKMEAWIANGVELGWLIDSYAKSVHVYEAGVVAPRIETGVHIAGSGPVAGFVLDLEEVWRCYE